MNLTYDGLVVPCICVSGDWWMLGLGCIGGMLIVIGFIIFFHGPRWAEDY